MATLVKTKVNKSASDRGSADCYYGRPAEPNMIVDNVEILECDMSSEQVLDYFRAYRSQYESKQFKGVDATLQATEHMAVVNDYFRIEASYQNKIDAKKDAILDYHIAHISCDITQADVTLCLEKWLDTLNNDDIVDLYYKMGLGPTLRKIDVPRDVFINRASISSSSN